MNFILVMNYAVNHVDVSISHIPLKLESILMCNASCRVFFTEMILFVCPETLVFKSLALLERSEIS